MRSEKLLIQLQARIKTLEADNKKCHEQCESLKEEIKQLKEKCEKEHSPKSSRRKSSKKVSNESEPKE